MKRTLILFAVAATLACSTADAKNKGTIPKDAVPMTPEEISIILSGNTFAPIKGIRYYFSPDGILVALGTDGWFAEGTWKVNGNSWCLDSIWHGPDKSKTDSYAQCSEKYKLGKKIYTKNTKGEDKWLGDVTTDQEKKFKKGDTVTAEVAKLKKKYGY
ncbi:DUF995 domain-containing protein [Nordella sp. HKS 07]|uniref:DUF995 domain-containing protein n=1 Tax=Nordella sp. HKS 07 TaxID=2712222 RepID=UPI0013E0FFD7|nr:DUF995 domain-containing protein [Nordella sp. HKS 07]QIG46767.1 DUF995 domain-containing protein [Nordella sp. HKS 07]